MAQGTHTAMRAVAFCVIGLVAGCAAGEHAAPRATPTDRAADPAPAQASPPAPELRLPDGIAPVSYDLTLDIDPAEEAFTGHVAIAISVTAPGTTRLWLHAVALTITRARVRTPSGEHTVAVYDGAPGAQMIGIALPHAVGRPAGERITVELDYQGRLSDLSGRQPKDEEGLFRKRAGGDWYVYSQGQSIFARRFVPSFDEPRWKSAWRVTLIVPVAMTALGNAPIARERIADIWREVQLAEVAALPSYLLAIAVGPFELVDVPALGRARMPARLAVLKGDRARTHGARTVLPRLVDALERYLDLPLPGQKLDIVAVPEFFGAMENPGLITFDSELLLGGDELAAIAAHELAHQWFGNLVTPAWWDDLWLSEAFASWLAERVTAPLAPEADAVLAHLERASALEADQPPGAQPIVRTIASLDEIEPAFNAIAYAKAGAVVAMFERLVGAPAFRAAVRSYLTAHAGRSVGSRAFLDALARASTPAASDALAAQLAHAGTPVVELAVRCTGAPAILASGRDGLPTPVCVRYPAAGQPVRTCFLAGAGTATEHALPAGAACPAWLAGNDGGRGYYHVAWRTGAPVAPVRELSPEERLARGDDGAAAIARGELAFPGALAEITALTAERDPYGQLAALAIAREIDPLVDPAVRPAWVAWLAARFPNRLNFTGLAPMAGTPAGRAIAADLVELIQPAIPRPLAKYARTLVERSMHRRVVARQVALAAAHDAAPLFERMVRAATDAKTDEHRRELLTALGRFPAAFAPRVVDLLVAPRPANGWSAADVWPALTAMLDRGETSLAAWQALHARLPEVLAALSRADTSARRDARWGESDGSAGREGTGTSPLIDATRKLCDRAARDQLAAAFPSDATSDALATTLAVIDRCIARRAAAGDLAAALAAASPPVRQP